MAQILLAEVALLLILQGVSGQLDHSQSYNRWYRLLLFAGQHDLCRGSTLLQVHNSVLAKLGPQK
jgi:hypothetical protein